MLQLSNSVRNRMFNLRLRFALALCLNLVNYNNALDSLLVQLPDGPVQGHPAVSYDNRSYVAFEGIPYAKPPLNELRFRAPQKPTRWEAPLIATKTYICTQLLPIQLLGDGMLGQEDCLYINVYVPSITQQQQRDVVVHIHGGAFVLGAPKMMAGPRYIMNEDVAYVTFNYRLGIFGFLSTNDAAASGNWGLKDQNFALQWVKDNIQLFGGNPASITLTGHSAGGASVHYHLLSNKSKGLFDKAMLMSGTALNPWALTEDPLTKAQKLGGLFTCPSDDNQKLVECLRQVPGRDLGKAMKEFFKFGNVVPVTPFGPTVEYSHEEAFITKSPYRLLQGREVANDVPTIISFVKDEGIFPSGFFASIGQIDNIKKKWFEVMQYGLDLQDTVAVSDWPEVLRKIKEHYYPNDDLNKQNLNNLTLLWTDRFYLLAIEKTIRLHLKASELPMYVYCFDYDSPGFNIFPSVKGVAHSEDLQLMFNLPIAPARLTESDHEMSHLMTKILSNFAKQNSIPMEDWTPMRREDEVDDMEFYEITRASGNKMAIKKELAPAAFWSELPIREEY